MADEQNREKSDVGRRVRRKLTILGPIVTAFSLIVAAAAVIAYRFGEGVIYINDRTISELNALELTSGAAVGIVGAFIGVGAAAVGALVTLVAGVLSVGFGAFGIVVGMIVALGVVTGPILLIGLIGILIKRRYWPDVI
ncbi:hypothetical protein [Parvularcula sp. LCG005]|uniref:hypothetical protein n=1 Tax=Parvularcula sp. LCG005 TaxID=3078805 RepID=UPI0029421583|nr:hypothetical protein [Parvularcula sp. LCG005]WOI54011.1 hypothetical protein RUI03_03165 [Parvularcula sp. LCG005]